jgi:indole-3-glycerol phosphate synthase
VRARESVLSRGELEAIVAQLEPPPNFAAALMRPTVAVIAELKRQSPSKGVLSGSLDAGRRAVAYAEGGAAALSILTEATRFGGSLGDLRDARVATALPLLRKDFITDPVQLLEARAFGASAALLIARALPPAQLASLAMAALAVGITPLVEVRNEAELAEAVAIPGAVIGVNSRNLETLEIEPAVAARLLPLVPADRIAVYESGVASPADVVRAAELGADAVLVGSVLSTAADPVAMVRGLVSVPRVGRG